MIKRLSTLLLLFFLVGTSYAFVYYEINGEINNKEITINSIDLIHSKSKLTNVWLEEEYTFEDDFYYFEIIDKNGRKIYSEEIMLLSFFLIENFEEKSEIVFIEDFNFTVYLPHIEGLDSIIIKDHTNKSILKYNLFYEKEYTEVDSHYEDEPQKRFFLFLIFFILILLIIFLIFYFIFTNKE